MERKKGNPYRSNKLYMKEKGESKAGGFNGGVTYVWEVGQEIESHYKDGGKSVNREFRLSCGRGVKKPQNNAARNPSDGYLIIVDGSKMKTGLLAIGRLYIYKGSGYCNQTIPM